ncbi:MobA/MobL family protein [Ligilactobacillus ruminis]|uniref:MobA/MobL family protein n=1 Tax=Ligilactobacillus ruminis TaxID=1623 RepID=UPI001F4E82F9|nr:MobA/MobL family protein [Ligilactobacillus ruminis]
MKIISRQKNNGKTRSAVACAAYRSGERLKDEREGKWKDYTRKEEVIHGEINLPTGADKKFLDRQFLWNTIERNEKRADAQLARDFVIAFPKQLTVDQQIEVMRKFSDKLTEQGMICDWNIHEKEGNPHCHMMTTMRSLSDDGITFQPKMKSHFVLDDQGNKIPKADKQGNQIIRNGKRVWIRRNEPTNDWNNKKYNEIWKQEYADICNQYLEPEFHITFDVEEGKLGQVHEGTIAREREKRGLIDERCELNRKIREYNRQVDELNRMKKELEETEKREKELEEELNREPRDMKDVVADVLKQAEGTLKKYVFADQLSRVREIPGLFDIMKKYKPQIDDYVAKREKLQGRPEITKAIAAIKSGAKAYRDELYEQLTPREKAMADKYQRKQEGQKRSQTVPHDELTKAPEPKTKDGFTSAPPKRKKHGMRKTLHQIGKNLDNTQEKRKALQDYEKAQRAVEREQRRMQHRDDWDMD